MPAHLHSKLMLQYAQDAQTTETPWELWEYAESVEVPLQWKPLINHPRWFSGFHYRRKPKCITISNVSIPLPLQTPPIIGTIYWIPTITSAEIVSARQVWYGSSEDFCWLQRGLIHTSEEAARQHAEALLSFNVKIVID